jgi:cell division protein FtsQ
VTLVAALAGVVLLAGWVLWGTSLAGVRQVRVTGTGFLSPAEVRQAAAVADQTPLLRVRPGEVAARVAALAPVAQARVRRDWPDTVVIEVVERTAVAAVPDREGFALVDAGGLRFRSVPERPADLPVVVVAGPGPDREATGAALAVLAALTPRLRAELAAVTVAGPAGIRLTLHSGRTVVWGDRHDSADKARVATALLDRAGETIDVSALEVVSVR